AVWDGYTQQPAASIVRLHDAQCAFRVTGAGVVALIDTGIDPNHPALASAVVPGYDFTRNTPGGDETADAQVTQESASVLDQESASVLDASHAAYGHGTMTAGVVHLTAPTAKLMPLKAFAASGSGYTSDILRAVYYAAKNGAKVLSMSFSR